MILHITTKNDISHMFDPSKYIFEICPIVHTRLKYQLVTNIWKHTYRQIYSNMYYDKSWMDIISRLNSK